MHTLSRFSLAVVALLAASSVAHGSWLVHPSDLHVYEKGEPIVLSFEYTGGYSEGNSGETFRVLDNVDRPIASFSLMPSDTPVSVTLPPPSYGWYRVVNSEGETLEDFGVYLPRARYENSIDTAIGIDGAINQQRPERRYEMMDEEWVNRQVALMTAAGVKYNRERYRPEQIFNVPGLLELDEVEGMAALPLEIAELAFRAQHEAGIGISALFSEGVRWLREDREKQNAPDDLRAVYDYHRESAKRLGRFVDIWEIWNEPDLESFFLGTANEYASYLKAASWGLHDGVEDPVLAFAPLALEPKGFARTIFENGVQAYADVFNYHTYGDPVQQYGTARNRIDFMNEVGLGSRPIYLTETGLHLKAQVKGDLPPELSHEVCRHIVKTYAETAAAGVDKTFYFIWNWYLDGQYGSFLDADELPTERHATLATMNRMLADAQGHRGILEAGPKIRAHLFAVGNEEVVVFWSQSGERTVELRAQGDVDLVYMTGESLPVVRNEEALRIIVGEDPLFARAASFDHVPVPTRVEREPSDEAWPASRIVMDLRFPTERLFDRGRGAYVVAAGESLEGTMSVYNFGAEDWRDSVTIEIEGGWEVEPAEFEVSLSASEDLIRIPITVTAPGESSRTKFFRLRAATDGGDSVLATRFAFPFGDLEPTRVVTLAKGPGQLNFEDHHMSGVDAKKEKTSDGVFFRYTNQQNGVWWAYPSLSAANVIGEPTYDFTEFQAIRYHLDVKEIQPGTFFAAIFVEPQGTQYVSPKFYFDKPGQYAVVTPFADAQWVSVSPSDPPDFSLNLDDLSMLRIGVNHLGARRLGYPAVVEPGYSVAYEVTAIELLSYE